MDRPPFLLDIFPAAMPPPQPEAQENLPPFTEDRPHV